MLNWKKLFLQRVRFIADTTEIDFKNTRAWYDQLTDTLFRSDSGMRREDTHV